MSRHIDCPVCGARNPAARYNLEGCWFCNADAERDREDALFEEFMAQPEEERWRALWRLAHSQ